MRIANYTPHDLVIFRDGVEIARWPSLGVARVAETATPAADLVTDQGPVPAVDVVYGTELIGLPEPTEGVLLVVSRITAAATTRTDIAFPAREVRDPHDGHVIGCGALGRFTRGGADA